MRSPKAACKTKRPTGQLAARPSRPEGKLEGEPTNSGRWAMDSGEWTVEGAEAA